MILFAGEKLIHGKISDADVLFYISCKNCLSGDGRQSFIN
jgi:hypothetical protein